MICVPEKVRNFSVLNEKIYQTAWLVANCSPFGCERRAWPHAGDSPHFRMQKGKSTIFSKFGFSIKPKLVPARPLSSSRTPQGAIHFPLAASGSQSALYACLSTSPKKASCPAAGSARRPGQTLSPTDQYMPFSSSQISSSRLCSSVCAPLFFHAFRNLVGRCPHRRSSASASLCSP